MFDCFLGIFEGHLKVILRLFVGRRSPVMRLRAASSKIPGFLTFFGEKSQDFDPWGPWRPKADPYLDHKYAYK